MENRKNQIKNKITYVMYAAIILAALVFFYISVIRALFGGTVWDKGVYTLGCLFFAVLMCHLVRITSFTDILEYFRDKNNIPCTLQVISIACVALFSLYYLDSASNYGHLVATEYMDFALGIFILCFYTKKQILNRWVIGAGVIRFIYFIYDSFGHNRDAKAIYIYILMSITGILYFMLVTAFVREAFKGQIKKRISGFGVLVFVFFILILIFSNTRTWVWSVAIPFTMLYLQPVDAEKESRILGRFCYGIMLAFWLMFGASVIFRPYYSFQFTRYPGWFASVASAALFWTLCFGCTLSAVLARLKKQASVNDCFFEICTFAMVCVHALLSMARTGLLAEFVCGAVAFITAELIHYRDSFREGVRRLLIVLLPVFLVFPVVYTLLRCGPALVAFPARITRAEWFSDQIQKGERPDSTKYMNIPQLGETFLEKVAGVDINLTEILGSVSGPTEPLLDENGNVISNEVGYFEVDGQIFSMKDYSFHNDEDRSVANGRFDIFKIYAGSLNLTGHDNMQPEEYVDTGEIYHAHNSYMQVAFDHGIITGLIFLLLVFLALVKSFGYYRRNHQRGSFAIMPLMVVISFMIAGITEWVFHPSVPMGFAFVFALTALISEDRHEEH